MDPKYSNIFWHQGVKIFKDKYYQSEQGQTRIAHLENDVTKVLLNLLQHCNHKVLKEFLSLISVKDHPGTFKFDFQVTNTNAYRQRKNRIILSIIGAFCEQKSNPNYQVEKGQPDACIYNDQTAILIEVKTQSPLVYEQIQGYVTHYLGSATFEKTITWEMITEKFGMLSRQLTSLDRFLLNQFCDFMELIGIAEFSGFKLSDFTMLGELRRVKKEDYVDFKRILHKKIEKFMILLKDELQESLKFLNFDFKIAQVHAKSPDVWSAFYFFNGDPNVHVNRLPNVNFNFLENGINLSINAEIQSAIKIVLDKVKKHPKEFEKAIKRLKDFSFTLYYKFQYLPMDNFIWRPIPGYAIISKDFASQGVITDISQFENEWENIKNSILFEMKSGFTKHPSGRLFNDKEIQFSQSHNPRPNYTIRVEKFYLPEEIVKMKKSVVRHFYKEIAELKELVEFLLLS